MFTSSCIYIYIIYILIYMYIMYIYNIDSSSPIPLKVTPLEGDQPSSLLGQRWATGPTTGVSKTMGGNPKNSTAMSIWIIHHAGWWFGTFFIFPYIGNNHPNWLIFFRGVQTTNQHVILCRFLRHANSWTAMDLEWSDHRKTHLPGVHVSWSMVEIAGWCQGVRSKWSESVNR